MRSDLPASWSLIPLDAGLRPLVDPAPLLRERRALPAGAAAAGVVTGPLSGVWWGPTEGAEAVVAWPSGSAGLYSERRSGRGWKPAGAVVPVWGPDVEWVSGGTSALIPRSQAAQTLRAFREGDPAALRQIAEAAGVEVEEIAPSGDWQVARWPQRPPPIPWDLAPEALTDVIYPLAKALGFSTSGVGVAVVGLASAALMARVVVDMAGLESEDGSTAWTEKNPGLYTMIVAPSSARKSGLFDELLPPWHAYRARVVARAVEQQKEWKRAQVHARVKERGRPDVSEVEEIVDVLNAPEPIPPAVLTDNTSPAAVADEIARHAYLLYANPDAANFFRQSVGDTGADIKAFLNAWAGDPSLPTLRIGRKGAPAAGAPLRAGMVAAIQPGVLFEVGKVAAFADQGLLARILWAVWDKPSGEGGRAFPKSASAAWTSLLERFWAIPEVVRDDTGRDRGHLRRVTLSARSTRALLDLLARLRHRTRPGGELYYLDSWVGKAHGQAARLAALFALSEDARTCEVPDRWVDAAIDIVETGLLEHAIAAWSLTRWPPETRTAIHLWAAMRGAGPIWTRARVAERAGRVDVAPADVDSALKALVDRGFLRLVGPGIWHANPRAEDPPDLD